MYYSIPVRLKEVSGQNLQKVDLKTSVEQHLELLLDIIPGQCYCAPSLGCSLPLTAFNTIPLGYSQVEWEREVHRTIKKSIEYSIIRYEPRIAELEHISVTSYYVKKGDTGNTILKGSRRFIMVKIRAILMDGNSLPFEKNFPFK